MEREFIFCLVFVTLASGLFWLDFFRSYQADITVLVISKSGTESIAQEVSDNMATLTSTLSFYERVLTDNDLIDDTLFGYAPEKRKALWNDMIEVKRPLGSSTLLIQVTGATGEQATYLSKQVTQTMFSLAGVYYNVKTDIDMRIVDGPLTQYTITQPFFFSIASIATGVVVTTVFFWLLNVLPTFIDTRKSQYVRADVSSTPGKAYPEFSLGETVPWIDPRKFIPAKPVDFSFQNTPEKYEESAIHPSTYAPAPANLPIADEETEVSMGSEESIPLGPDVLLTNEEVMFMNTLTDESHGVSALTEENIKKGEPTQDEYKRRLNELLTGGK